MSTTEYNKEYHKKTYYISKKRRANCLIRVYKREDEKYNRGQCNLTQAQLINLWDNGCYYCGEKDWKKLGVDRIDNSKHHTIDNVVCSCLHCNASKPKKNGVIQCNLDGIPIAEYNSIIEAANRTNSNYKCISKCCLGNAKKHNGFIWHYK